MSWRQIEGENDVGLNTEKPSALLTLPILRLPKTKKLGGSTLPGSTLMLKIRYVFID